MPYKDIERKKEWEGQHHSQRLARRRELRRIEAAQNATQPAASWVEGGGASLLWLPFVGGTALASYSPKLAMGAGSLALLLAGIYKKDLRWWIVGIVVLTNGSFLSMERSET